MNEIFQNIVKTATGAREIFEIEEIQNLWSGYGKILRYGLESATENRPSVVIKHVRLPIQSKHPRGWNTNLSHERKLRSYQVETIWYKNFSKSCTDDCHVPVCLALESEGDEVLMVLEDLDASGFSGRLSSVGWTEIKSCLKWLANFHARFLGIRPTGLWDIGTYWHLDTRPDELDTMDESPLKKSASAIDKILNEAHFKTLVHGDAKLANFCFNEDGTKVSAVDFQYVGGGCGMKDVAYFVGSCLREDDCEQYEDRILDFYFNELKTACDEQIDTQALELEWRKLYPVAWADFHRFLKGWSPGHWKINSYSERVSREVIAQL